MKITKGTQKALLFELFYQPNPRAGMPGQSSHTPLDFPLESLFDAANAKKRLDGKDANGMITFDNEEIEFIPAEVVTLKKLFDAKKTWPVDKADVVGELKEIFNPKSNL